MTKIHILVFNLEIQGISTHMILMDSIRFQINISSQKSPATSCYARPCYVLSRLVTSCHVLSRPVTSCHVLSRPVTSCHVMFSVQFSAIFLREYFLFHFELFLFNLKHVVKAFSSFFINFCKNQLLNAI